MDLRTILRAEFARRKQRNARYSLRAFARSLHTHHATLSRIFNERLRVTPRVVRQLGARVGLSASEVRDVCIVEHCLAIKRVVADERFRADSRWIAMMTGIPLDEVNMALHWLLYRRELTMSARTAWTLGDA